MNYSHLLCYSQETQYIFAKVLFLSIHWKKQVIDFQHSLDFPNAELKSRHPQKTWRTVSGCLWYCNLLTSLLIPSTPTIVHTSKYQYNNTKHIMQTCALGVSTHTFPEYITDKIESFLVPYKFPLNSPCSMNLQLKIFISSSFLINLLFNWGTV